MSNYEYIIASLPDIAPDAGKAAGLDVKAVEEEIRSQLSGSDLRWYDLMLRSFDDSRLDAEFYAEAETSSQNFIKEYFAFDRKVRNTKVMYLNKALGRPLMQDVLTLAEDEEVEPLETADAVLASDDILAREKGIDDLMWEKAEELVTLHVLDLDIILGFTARLRIIDRWLRLDPAAGREMFRKLVDEIRKTR